jgi:hypothetical protein
MAIQSLPEVVRARDFDWRSVNMDHILKASEVMAVWKYDITRKKNTNFNNENLTRTSMWK